MESESPFEVVRHFLLGSGEKKFVLIDPRKAFKIKHVSNKIKFGLKFKTQDPGITLTNLFKKLLQKTGTKLVKFKF